MTHLKIQQSSNVEIVSASLIQKLYETALTTQDTTLAGNLQCEHCKLVAYEYLMGNVEGTTRRFPNLTINVTNGLYITFADSEVERVLMANGASSDGFGISNEDAASFNLGQEFKANTTITSFPEYGKFTLANTASADLNHCDKFQDCTNLASIDMSKITRMNRNDFRNTAITTINAPMLSSFGFDKGASWSRYNTHLTTVTSLGSITKIPHYCFRDCNSLTTVNLPSECTEICQEGFYNCRALQNIDLTNITYIGGSAFYNCKNLGYILNGTLDLLSTNVTTIDDGAFRSCGITKVYFPTTLTRLGKSSSYEVFNDNTLTEYKGLDNITDLYSASVGNITNAIYMGELISSYTLPVHCRENIRTSVKQIYLPKFETSSITKYQIVYDRLDRSLTAYRPYYQSPGETYVYMNIGLIYFKNVLNFELFEFCGAKFKNIVINRTTPPSLKSVTYAENLLSFGLYDVWSSKLFGDNYEDGVNTIYIYVPDSAVAAYQADPNYNIYNIRGINEVDPNTNLPYLTRYATNALWEAAGKPEDALIEEYM